mgnify:CR=1 FL=1
MMPRIVVLVGQHHEAAGFVAGRLDVELRWVVVFYNSKQAIYFGKFDGRRLVAQYEKRANAKLAPKYG